MQKLAENRSNNQICGYIYTYIYDEDFVKTSKYL